MVSVKDELHEIYSQYNPAVSVTHSAKKLIVCQALGSLEQTLKDWKGREAELLLQVREKYNVDVDTSETDLNAISKKLKETYRKYIRPIEEAYKFDVFFTPYLEDVDFDAKPMVLLLGQYSVGKTTFIKHLVKRDFSGMRIGPEVSLYPCYH